MRQVRPAVLHLRDPRLRVVRMHPVLVRALLRTLPVQLRQILARRRLDPRRPGHLLQPLIVAQPVVAPHDRAHRRIRLQRRRVDTQRLAAQQPRPLQQLQHPPEHRRVRFHAQALARFRQRRMLRRVLRPPVSQKLTQRQRVPTPPGNAPLRADPFQVAHHHHSEIHPGSNPRPTPIVRVELTARLFRELVKPAFRQKLVQGPVERVVQGPNLARHHEHLALPSLRPLAYRRPRCRNPRVLLR